MNGDEPMNPGQEKFLNFILDRVDETQRDTVREYMEQNFKKQQEGMFGRKDIEETRTFLQDKVNPQYLEEVKTVMQQFAENYSK